MNKELNLIANYAEQCDKITNELHNVFEADVIEIIQECKELVNDWGNETCREHPTLFEVLSQKCHRDWRDYGFQIVNMMDKLAYWGNILISRIENLPNCNILLKKIKECNETLNYFANDVLQEELMSKYEFIRMAEASEEPIRMGTSLVAALTGWNPKTIRSFAKANKIPHAKDGREFTFEFRELSKWYAEWLKANKFSTQHSNSL